ncbi:hypothetical protein WN71_024195 [Streptomyces mangrovisoli]|uniref:DUF304 domain-containing protein n=2 Tax=Streptomyces mangrovisoli TaxID=1428628 RepID=A0A1J4NW99_9ACTN|nr:hypothetical protein WN71_024195 [Streptomyces mangrovisoli]
MAWRTIAALGVLAFGMLLITRPPSVLFRLAVVAGVLLVWFCLRLGWRRASAALELNRCYLYADGLVLTDQFGALRAAVAWADVTRLKRTYGAWLFTVSHRVELTRRGAPSLTFSVLGSQSELVDQLQAQAARNRIPQQTVHIRVQ